MRVAGEELTENDLHQQALALAAQTGLPPPLGGGRGPVTDHQGEEGGADGTPPLVDSREGQKQRGGGVVEVTRKRQSHNTYNNSCE